jgi:hypothetical protein
MVFSFLVRVSAFALAGLLMATSASAQDRRAIVFGTIGGGSIGHADSEMGNAAIFGGGAGVHLTPRLVVEGDVQGARVSNVFGRARHDFTETMITGSLLFRSTPDGRVHFLGGGGVGLQWAHTDLDDPPFRIVETERIRHLHGRAGAEWDVSSRLAIRTEGVLWFGTGLDWVVGARGGLSYRF